MQQKYWDKYCRYMDKQLEGSSWSDRIRFYCILLISLALIFLPVIIYILILDTSNNTIFTQYNTTELRNMGFFDNERYLISALVQSLAATIALVVSLSLIAIQFAAESHSSRTIEFYKRNPDMWILISIYIVVIFYGLALLKVIDIGLAGITMEIAIYVAYFLGFFAFICLIPYIWSTLNLLKISTAIKWLEKEITKENILEAFKDSDDIIEKDPVQPIIDIMNSAFERNDYETVRNGLKVIKKNTIVILGNPLEEKEEKEIMNYIVQHIAEFGIYGANKKKEIFVRDIIISLYEIGVKAIENERKNSFCEVTKALEQVGIKAAENELEVTLDVVLKLIEITKKAIEKKSLESCTLKAIKAFENISIKTTDNRLKNINLYVVNGLQEIGAQTIEKRNENISEEIAIALGYIGTEFVKKDLRKVGFMAVRVLEKMGTEALKKELDRTSARAMFALGNVGAQDAKSNDPKIMMKSIERLRITIMNLPERKFRNTTRAVVKSFENIGVQSIEPLVLTTIIDDLKNIGVRASKEGLEYNLDDLISRQNTDTGKIDQFEITLASRKIDDEVIKALNSIKENIMPSSQFKKRIIDAIQAIEDEKINSSNS